MKQEKVLLLDELKRQMGGFDSFLVMRYENLLANTANDFRGGVAKRGGDVEVMRKRLLLKAADECGVKLDMLQLGGHIGIVYSGKDAIEMTKYVIQFSKDNNNAIELIGGYIDGQVYNGADVATLSQLPGKDEMRAQLLSVLESPLSQTLAVMDALLTSVMHCLENKSKKEESQN